MSVEIKNLYKSFDDKVIFRDFSYKFEDKGLYIIKGDSGIGKTTLLRIIAGLDTKYEGEVTGGGAKNISYAFQEHRLFEELSALENLLIVYKSAPTEKEIEEAKSLLTTLHFTEADMSLRPRELSGGMKQRVSLARALIKSSGCLLLDEPTKELDAELVKVVTDLISAQAKERCVIAVTHDDEHIYSDCTLIKI